jgi:putative restriction endonuclease
MLEHYKAAFSKLRSDTSPARWESNTNHRAPHKPFLLLTIMDLIAQGEIAANFIELKAELVETFDLYWVKIMGPDKEGGPLLPFYHLKSDGFWHLVPVSGMDQVLAAAGQIRSFRQLNQLVLGAKLDDALFDLLLNADARDDLRRVLIETYFAPGTRQELVEVGKITAESFEYSRELLDRLRGTFRVREAPEMDARYHVESRSTAFRRIIVRAYNHTCAMCGIRIVTPEGRTAVEAAHIIPWNIAHNDDPRNGMALCGLHHWIFDQGMVSVTEDYHIRVSPAASDETAAAEPLLSLEAREIQRPAEHILWPAKKALEWHYANIFRSERPLRLL